MEDLLISKYVKLFELMSLESKIELLSKLTESMKKGFSKKAEPDKKELSRELFGAWADIDDDITELIYSSRTISKRDVNFD
ncbi:hypothetical protein [Lewinella cohaerens]|uniref:hypothetical protein n=1 Tax=Lewinella cohaerens TaxID=70995 RepID=UPI00036D2C95|nr:hypothetical protein [Lewinella cohaerens]